MYGIIYILAILADAFGIGRKPQKSTSTTPPPPPPPRPPLPTPEEDRKRDRKNDVGAKLQIAEYRVSRLKQMSGNCSAFEARLQLAQEQLNRGEFDAAEQAIADCQRDIETATFARAWVRQWATRTYWLTGHRPAEGAETDVPAMPVQLTAVGAEDALALPDLDADTRFLVQAALADIITHDTCAGRWHHFIYPRFPNYERGIKLGEARLKLAREQLGADGPAVLATLVELAHLYAQQGRFHGVPGIGATRERAMAKQKWELEQYEQAWNYLLEAYEICQRRFGPEDQRTEHSLIRLMIAPRRRDKEIAPDLQEKLKACKKRTFKS